MSADASAGPSLSPRIHVYEATTPAQREKLYRFRYQIFTQEQHKYVDSADHGRQMLVDALDDVAIHLVAEKDGEIIGSLRQIRGARHATPAMRENFSLDAFAQFPDTAFGISGRLLVLPEHRGSRALLHLLLAIYNSGRAAGITFDFIGCNPHLVRLYEQMGYRRYRPYYYDAGLGFQIPLVLVSDDVEHLKRVASVFAGSSLRWPTSREHSRWLVETFPGQRTFVSPVTMAADEFAALLSSKVNRNDIPLLEGFSESELDDFLKATTHFQLEAGTRIVRSGDMGQELYLILNGVAEVFARNADDGKPALLATLGRGDTFGEMSVLTGKPRASDVAATSELEVIFIDQIALKRLVKGRPEIAARLLFNLSRSLAERLEFQSIRFATVQTGNCPEFQSPA